MASQYLIKKSWISFCIVILMAPAGFFVTGRSILGLEAYQAKKSSQTRPAHNDSELKFWLENMLRYHRYTLDEAAEVTGIESDKIKLELDRLSIDLRPSKPESGKLILKPYPGGRHPRIGFLEGAIDPHRETKISVFTPWDTESYVVVDLPEAIFSNLGLTYLAHTHIPTIFDKTGTKLDVMEWKREGNGDLSLTRNLPNGISYSARAMARNNEIQMELELKNGTGQKLTGLKVQQCAMLKGTKEFNAQTNSNKKFISPYAVVGNMAGNRWVLHAWSRPVRVWGNAPCPCLHSDPQFPDLEPGQQAKLVGRLWFYEGNDVENFINKKIAEGWDKK